MGLWATRLRIGKCLCDYGRQRVRRMALQTGLSKSSVHRLTQAMERRGVHPEAWGWETAEGRRWFTRLVVATLSTVSRTRGVGVETLREFFARLRLATQVGCAPAALRHVLQTLEATAVETAETWEQDAGAAGEVREMIGGVEATFLERMMVVFQDVPTRDTWCWRTSQTIAPVPHGKRWSMHDSRRWERRACPWSVTGRRP